MITLHFKDFDSAAEEARCKKIVRDFKIEVAVIALSYAAVTLFDRWMKKHD